MKKVKIRNSSSPFTEINAKICDTFVSRFKGLMFTKNIEPDFGLFFIDYKESRMNSSIHMMFMNYDITVLWLDKDMVIVDKVLAKKWVPMYVPKRPAQYILELHPTKYSEYSVGDKLLLVDGD